MDKGRSNISLLSTANLDVQKEETSVDLTSTHLLTVELKTRWDTGSTDCSHWTNKDRGPIVSSSGLQMT